MNHVNSQLPYALSVAGVSFICYLIAGLVKNPILPILFGMIVIAGFLFFLKKHQKAEA